MSERRAARAFSLALDGWLAGEALPEDEAGAEMAAVRRLIQLPQLLPSAPPELTRRVLSAARPAKGPSYRPWLRWKALGPALAAVLLLLAVGLFYPPGRAALAAFAARFGLGPFAVEVTPQPVAKGDRYVIAVGLELSTLDEARATAGFDLFTPAYLPVGYALQSIVAVSYEDMPLWIPQPFYVELQYGPQDEQNVHHLTLREFGLSLSEGDYLRRIREVSFGSEDVSQAEEVRVGDVPGVLLTMLGDRTMPPLRRLIWREGEAMLELLSQTLDGEEMLDLARQMETVR